MWPKPSSRSIPGLSRADMAVACDKTRLTEMRVCMSKDFSFRACAEVARRACTARQGRDAGDARRTNGVLNTRGEMPSDTFA